MQNSAQRSHALRAPVLRPDRPRGRGMIRRLYPGGPRVITRLQLWCTGDGLRLLDLERLCDLDLDLGDLDLDLDPNPFLTFVLNSDLISSITDRWPWQAAN